VKFASLAPGQEVAAADLIRRTVRETDATLPILSLRTFAQHLDVNISLWAVRAGAALFSVFGGLALGLAVVGVYGVKAYAVARRTREIGIRMALGAEPSAVLWMILREGALMLTSGIVIGLLLALATGKLVSGMLYEVGALDPVAFTIAPLVLAAAALLACYLPARRATKISPMTALRTE
jgi:ABC-type antimicrobial peptide transport system permease subunit